MQYKNNLPIPQKLKYTGYNGDNNTKFKCEVVFQPGEIKSLPDYVDAEIHILSDHMIVGGQCPNLECLDHPERFVHPTLDYRNVIQQKIADETAALKKEIEMIRNAEAAAEEKKKLQAELKALQNSQKKGK